MPAAAEEEACMLAAGVGVVGFVFVPIPKMHR